MRFRKSLVVAAVLLPVLTGLHARAKAPLADPSRRMMTVYLVLLKKGPAWMAEDSPATRALQEAHMANIRRLWTERQLIVAGPVEDSELRGIFVMSATSLDAARALAGTDPAVRAGRLSPEVYPWWIEKGVLPEAGQYCAPPPAK